MTKIVHDTHLVAMALKKGSVVALPSETVYGLGASIYQEEALKEIFSLKKRPQDNPLIVHAHDLKMIESIAYINDDFLKLYEAFMPGPLTVLLEKKQVSDTITCGLNTVAIRIPSHPLFLEVIRLLDEPIAAPSANLSGKPSSTQVEHVFKDFSPSLELILDGGRSVGGIESTIIKLYKDRAVILRPGLISKEAIEKVLEKPCHFSTKDTAIEAPGMKYRHYAPTAKVVLVDEIQLDHLVSEDVMILSEEKILAPVWQELTAFNLYKAFRIADDLNLSTIYVKMPSNLSLGLKNRLEKAARGD